MNFDQDIMERDGFGEYTEMSTSKVINGCTVLFVGHDWSLPCTQIPQFWLGYLGDPSDSGKIHNDVRQRYDSGDQEVIRSVMC